jgi:hypothetical protein
MHAAQTILGKPESLSAECYVPPMTKEKIMEMIKKGDERVNALQKELDLEANEALKEKDNKNYRSKKLPELRRKLDDLRAQCKSEYGSHYKISFRIVMSNKDIAEYQRRLKVEYKAKETTNEDALRLKMNPPLPTYGDLTIESIEDYKRNLKIVTYFFDDPLHALTHEVSEKTKRMEKYPEQDRNFEQDAGLHGAIPQVLMQRFYPEFYQYTNGLIQQAKAKAKPVADLPPRMEMDIEKFETYEWVATMKNPNAFKTDYAPFYTDNARHLWEVIKGIEAIAAAEIGLKTLIEKGDIKYHGEAMLELARMKSHKKNYKEAAEYFKEAEKRVKSEFTKEDHAAYTAAKAKLEKIKGSAKKQEEKTSGQKPAAHAQQKPAAQKESNPARLRL